MPNTSGAVNWVNVFFIDKRQQHDSETNVSFKKARKNVIGDGVKVIFKLHLNFYATTILKLLGELLTLLLAFLKFLVKTLVKSQNYYFNEKRL